MTADEFQQMAELIGGLSGDIQNLDHKFEEEFKGVKDRLDRIDKHGGLLQSGSHWVNRMSRWAEKMDRLMVRHEGMEARQL